MATTSSLIVVGVDESLAAEAALAFALDEGVAHGHTVEAVTAWLWTSPYDGMDHVTSIEEGHEIARAVQQHALERALGARTDRPVVSQTVVHAHAGQALVESAEGARMLVVGNGRKSALTRAVLGSISEYCVRHATAPVVVVADSRRLRPRVQGDLEAVPQAGPRAVC
jgi:nucleotide-binding universal stress UspA family protein